MTIQLFAQSAVATPKTTLEDFETWIGLLLEAQRDVLWQIGDLALAVERQHPSTFHQAFPEWVSPDLIARCKSVSNAYSPGERNILATWTIHMQNAKNPDRVEIVNAHVEAGHTSDEARKTPVHIEPAVTPDPVPTVTPAVEQADDDPRWLLAVDIAYYVQSFFTTHGNQAASEVASWLDRLIKRLHRDNNLTDAVMCFDGPRNHRKLLTQDWEEERQYKFARKQKEDELVQQMQEIPDLLKRLNYPCVSIDGMEADDVMASYAVQFPGRVSLLTVDKDLRQCLTEGKCNMLTAITWEQNAETGDMMPVYNWVNVKKHIQLGLPYAGAEVSGITPEQWPHFQAIAGDSTDNIKGCKGIGGKLAWDLIRHHGTVQGVLAACEDGTARVLDKHGEKKPITAIQRHALFEFAEVADVMLQLTTLRTDLNVPMITKLCLKDD